MTTTINDPIAIGSLVLKNRLYRAPVLEGAGAAPDPAAEYARHFVPNARAGVGLIVQGNTIVLPEGRTSPGMSAIDGRGRMLALAPLPAAVHEAGARIAIQLGHGGIFALESWHRRFKAARRSPPLAPSPLPPLLRAVHGGVRALSTEEVLALVRRFGLVASWAREAGYDAVQLAGSNAKLLHQFLSPTYNRRRDRFGGSVDGRAAILCEIRAAIAREAGADFPVLLKFPAFEPRSLLGPGIPLEDGLRIARLAEAAGFQALTPVAADALPTTAICRGDFPAESFRNPKLRRELREASPNDLHALATAVGMWLAARRYPFSPVWNRAIFREVRAAVQIPVFAVGGIRTPSEAAGILARGEADLIGIGRPFYAEPDLPRKFLAPGAEMSEESCRCESCNRCVLPQMLGLPGVCYNPAARGKERPRKEPGAAATNGYHAREMHRTTG